MNIFLITLLNCNDVIGIGDRIQSVVGLTREQKVSIMKELGEVVPSCPVRIQSEVKK
jgi:hypothetical protein